ncbi:LuxR C-terminal-related transcriptional regulator [Microbacterium istanbulense]|uniref:LuxR C-terminal-related transcriptional regulator n=1 Tax=Microbacterium istanbulense TaxID=3122049 RepID=A0ABU8LLT0_9MICO
MSAAQETGSDNDLVADAVRELARKTRFPVTFGGLIEDGVVSVTSIVGNRTHALDGLKVHPDRGLGGRAMMELRPRMTSDYRTSPHITHDYDVFVLGEGLRTLLAIPIVVDGRPRGVLYAGAWEAVGNAGITTAPAMEVAQSVATELRIRDEVARRLRTAPEQAILQATQREQLRETYAELRTIASTVTDDSLRQRLSALEERLLSITDERPAAPPTTPVAVTHLSRREVDVLACAALGSTNAEIGAELGLREGTVKAYVRAAMSKLDASTRHAAVARARRLGLLP